MFKFKTSSSAQRGEKPSADRPIFGPKTPAPGLESSFIFPAPKRPKGLTIYVGKKSEKPLTKKP